MSPKLLLSAIAGASLFGMASTANALTINWNDLTDGASNASGAGWTATATPRPFDQKTLNGFSGTGIEGGFVAGEVDLDGESITINFDAPQRLDSITLAFLFKDGNFGDGVSEVARLRISTSPFIAGDLSVITPTTATWSGLGGGPVVNVSPGDESGAGVWTILDPFGNMQVSSITMTALLVGSPPPSGSANSDFAFNQLNSTPVPEPVSAGLLGAALAGFAVARRRKA